MSQICTILTDFGEKDSYVAAMKGVLFSFDSSMAVVDLSHDISPQNVVQASYFWQGALPYYPPGTIHLGVVDPGVGTERKICVAEGGGQILVCPDNGMLTHWWLGTPGAKAYEVTHREYWRGVQSATFHGRDIFSPMAGALGAGLLKPKDCGPEIQPVLLDLPGWTSMEKGWKVAVTSIDHFGNCITSIPGEAIPHSVGHLKLTDGTVVRRVRTYGEAAEGELVLLEGSSGHLELAINLGSAQARLNLMMGDELELYRVEVAV